MPHRQCSSAEFLFAMGAFRLLSAHLQPIPLGMPARETVPGTGRSGTSCGLWCRRSTRPAHTPAASHAASFRHTPTAGWKMSACLSAESNVNETCIFSLPAISLILLLPTHTLSCCLALCKLVGGKVLPHSVVGGGTYTAQRTVRGAI